MTVDIICADAREALARFPDGHFHCCVTSPPFWGLRDYGLEPTVWGPDCEHEWGGEVFGGEGYENREGRWNHGHARDSKPEAWRKQTPQGAFCRRCNAWQGTLGLEPTPELYVEHLVSVMREVRRTLRDDGTLWLNLGDSYAGSWGNYHPNSPPGKHGQRLKETAHWNRPAYESQEFLPPTAKASYRRDRRAREDDPHKSVPGLKPKDLVGVPWMVAFALRADGWWLRSAITWCKGSPMPESVRDRPTSATEMLFLLAKSQTYYYDSEAVRVPYSEASLARMAQPTFWEQSGGPKDPLDGNRSARKALENLARSHKGSTFTKGKTGVNEKGRASELPREDGGGRNLWNWWLINPQPYPGAHFATFPEKLVEPCILAGCPEGGTVLDPFAGSGTVGLVAERLGRHSVLIDAKPEYVEMARHRTAQMGLMTSGATI